MFALLFTVVLLIIVAVYAMASVYKSDDNLSFDNEIVWLNCSFDTDLSSDAFIAAYKNGNRFETTYLTEKYGITVFCK